MAALKLLATRLPERKVAIGGEPGAGKSGALSMVVATIALDPDTVEAGTTASQKAGAA
jgi:predicted ATP-dependent serine protease